METQPKDKSLLLILLAILFSAVVTGSVVYTVQNKQNTDTKNTLQAQVDSLKTQIAALPTATPTPSSQPTVTAKPTPTPSIAPITIASAVTACQNETKITTLKDTSGALFTLCAEKLAVSGDVNEDGISDIVLPVASDSGKSVGEMKLAVFLNVNGSVHYAGISDSLNTDETLQSLTISGNKVKVAMTSVNPEMPNLTRTFAFNGTKLVDQTSY